MLFKANRKCPSCSLYYVQTHKKRLFWDVDYILYTSIKLELPFLNDWFYKLPEPYGFQHGDSGASSY